MSPQGPLVVKVSAMDLLDQAQATQRDLVDAIETYFYEVKANMEPVSLRGGRAMAEAERDLRAVVERTSGRVL